MVLANPPSSARRPPRPGRVAIAGGLAGVGVLLVAILLVSSFVPVDYLAIGPGSANPVAPRVSISGATTYPSQGDVEFVTVGIPKLNALGAVLGWIDPNADVVRPYQVYGTQSEEQNRQQNFQLMGYSKDFATYVALSRLGYKVGVSNGGVAIDSFCMATAKDGSCTSESPAAKALQKGDLVVAIDGKPINLATDISPALAGRKAGDKVSVTYRRNGVDGDQKADVELMQASGSDRVILGIVPNPNPPSTIKFDFPVDVKIDSGQVGGPSAGLAFTLALLDQLTPGGILDGRTVAATGTIELDGRVGEIGGIRQKTVAVGRTPASIFLAPASEVDAGVKDAAGSGLQVVGVNTLDDALKAIGGKALQYVRS